MREPEARRCSINRFASSSAPRPRKPITSANSSLSPRPADPDVLQLPRPVVVRRLSSILNLHAPLVRSSLACLFARSSFPPVRPCPIKKWIRRRARSTPPVPRAPAVCAGRNGDTPRSQRGRRQRDYRLALNHALESREQAQNGARRPRHVTLRGGVKRSVARSTP
jgi:hypothetical protein